MAYYLVPSAEAKLEGLKANDPELFKAFLELMDLIGETPNGSAPLSLIKELAKESNDEKCRRLAESLEKAHSVGTIALPEHARIAYCMLPSKSVTTFPMAVVIVVPGAPVGVTPPSDLLDEAVVTVVAIGGVLRQGGFI